MEAIFIHYHSDTTLRIRKKLFEKSVETGQDIPCFNTGAKYYPMEIS